MRKRPKQARSHDTVSVLLEAGAQLLERGGWAAFNTNAVARVAGVSVGTVYQYFPDKHALLESIRRRHFADVLVAVGVAHDSARTIGDRVDTLVDGLVRAHSASAAFHGALLERAPRALPAADLVRFEQAYVAAFTRLVSDASPGPALETSAELLAAAVEAAIHDAARRGRVCAPVFAHELKALLSGYLALSR